jgi:outer membrane protein OmpA-like peptidoglycan-associated protein
MSLVWESFIKTEAMKPRHLLFFLFCLANLAATAQRPAAPPKDSIPPAQEWTPREPLSPEEQQRRADKAAELEAMRQRFRRYQAREETAEQERAREAEDEGYLWSEAEAPQLVKARADSIAAAPAPAQNADALRLEISRNLRVKGETTPSSPALEPPASYELPSRPSSAPASSDWERDWQAPDAPPPANNRDTQWALELEARTQLTAGAATYKSGMVVPLAVTFSAAGTTLAPGPQPALDELLDALYAQPTMRIEVRVHAHVSLTTAAADAQSTQRAQAVIDYLLAGGILPERVQARGYGKRNPRSFDRSEEGQQLNERVELIVLQQ